MLGSKPNNDFNDAPKAKESKRQESAPPDDMNDPIPF
jgi:hypothetical protein